MRVLRQLPGHVLVVLVVLLVTLLHSLLSVLYSLSPSLTLVSPPAGWEYLRRSRARSELVGLLAASCISARYLASHSAHFVDTRALCAPNMAPRTKRSADAIDKQRPRRQHIILQTLPPVVLSTPTNTITIRFAMSAASLKSFRPQSLGSARKSMLNDTWVPALIIVPLQLPQSGRLSSRLTPILNQSRSRLEMARRPRR